MFCILYGLMIRALTYKVDDLIYYKLYDFFHDYKTVLELRLLIKRKMY